MDEPVLKSRSIAGVEAAVAGSEGPPLVLIGGPPTANIMFREVQRRLAPRVTIAPDLLSGAPPLGLDELLTRLSQVMAASGADTVLAHGLAVPLALLADGVKVALLSNGPVTTLDPVTRGLAALPDRALSIALRPRLQRRWLTSSVGLRRAVVNPYVMDRDTVAMLSDPLLVDPARRKATAAWIKALPEALRRASEGERVRPGRVGLIWGVGDAIYPLLQAEDWSLADRFSGIVRIPGGRWLHPEERPWALAEGASVLLNERRDPSLQMTMT